MIDHQEANNRPAISDYLMIGNLKTSALITHGRIDRLCTPDIDSPSVFGRLLDQSGGHWSVSVGEDTSWTSSYDNHYPIITHTAKTDAYEVVMTDFMPVYQVGTDTFEGVIRTVQCLSGSVTLTTSLSPEGDYGRSDSLIQNQGEGIYRYDQIVFMIPGSCQTHDGGQITCTQTLSQGESITMMMQRGDVSHTPATLEDTKLYRDKWIATGVHDDPTCARCAVTLKLMQYIPTGALVAAPTTSLPEQIGGSRNRDYRYTWIRDSTFILYGLSLLGHQAEAGGFFEFVEGLLLDQGLTGDALPDLDVMYTIHGQSVPEEQPLTHRSGYRDSSPVHIGNGAGEQFQLDGYGSLIDAYYFLWRRGMTLSDEMKTIIQHLIDTIQARRLEKDNGIREVRAGRQHYTYSKVMSRVGVDRALRMAEELGRDQHTCDTYQGLADEIKTWIWQHCYDESIQNFTQYPGTTTIDATNFLMVMVQFLDRHEDRTHTIITNTYQALHKNIIYIDRYNGEDGLDGEEGAFLLCSYWMIGAYAMVGETTTAQDIFDQLQSRLGVLLPEEIDGHTHKYLGNYPQAFSHLGYVIAKYYLERYRNKE